MQIRVVCEDIFQKKGEKMLQTKIYSVPLAGLEENPTKITLEAIPYYKKIQVLNNTGATIYYKYNDDDAEQELANNSIFELESQSIDEPLSDWIYIRGDGTIKVEVQYYPHKGFSGS